MPIEFPYAKPLVAISSTTVAVVGAAAVQIAPANIRRIGLIIEATGAAPIRIGNAGVTVASGFHMETHAGNHDRIEMMDNACPTDAVYAIRQTALDSEVCIIELTLIP